MNCNQVVLELHYLPSIQYMTKFIGYETVWLEQKENYTKGSYRNRCHLASANGLIRLSIPLQKGKNEQQSIQDVQIAYHDPWPGIHWQTIQSAYGKSPFFEFYGDELKDIILSRPKYLFEFNLILLNWILGHLNLKNNYLLTSIYQKTYFPPIFDSRNSIHPKKSRHKEDKFFKSWPYNQVFEEKNGFLPNLSILDLLFCRGPEASIILEQSIPDPQLKG